MLAIKYCPPPFLWYSMDMSIRIVTFRRDFQTFDSFLRKKWVIEKITHFFLIKLLYNYYLERLLYHTVHKQSRCVRSSLLKLGLIIEFQRQSLLLLLQFFCL